MLWMSLRTFALQRAPLALNIQLPAWSIQRSPVVTIGTTTINTNTGNGLSGIQMPTNSILGQLGREEWVSNGAEDAPVTDNTMYADSVLRKRRKKMKKHKLRKRRRAERSLKKRLGKI